MDVSQRVGASRKYNFEDFIAIDVCRVTFPCTVGWPHKHQDLTKECTLKTKNAYTYCS